jgi:hypothetical protein
MVLAVPQKTENGKLFRTGVRPFKPRELPGIFSRGNSGISHLEIQGMPNYLLAKNWHI